MLQNDLTNVPACLRDLREAISDLQDALPDAALDHKTQPFKDNPATVANAQRLCIAVASVENAINRVRVLFDMAPETDPEPFAACWQQLGAIYRNYESAFTTTHH